MCLGSGNNESSGRRFMASGEVLHDNRTIETQEQSVYANLLVQCPKNVSEHKTCNAWVVVSQSSIINRHLFKEDFSTMAFHSCGLNSNLLSISIPPFPTRLPASRLVRASLACRFLPTKKTLRPPRLKNYTAWCSGAIWLTVFSGPLFRNFLSPPARGRWCGGG